MKSFLKEWWPIILMSMGGSIILYFLPTLMDKWMNPPGIHNHTFGRWTEMDTYGRQFQTCTNCGLTRSYSVIR